MKRRALGGGGAQRLHVFCVFTARCGRRRVWRRGGRIPARREKRLREAGVDALAALAAQRGLMAAGAAAKGGGQGEGKEEGEGGGFGDGGGGELAVDGAGFGVFEAHHGGGGGLCRRV